MKNFLIILILFTFYSANSKCPDGYKQKQNTLHIIKIRSNKTMQPIRHKQYFETCYKRVK
jgi:hypothetical protein